MNNLVTNIHDKLTGNSFDINPNDSNNFRRVQMPQPKFGLGSIEAELITMVKKYLEIVGLVVFVWLLGYFHFSISWILFAVFIYLFREKQRTQFKERHEMLKQININEEQYIKARLDELPSWVFFPDVERAEWVNRIIKQAWPYANKYLDKAFFHDIMIPMIRGTSPVLADFAFEKLDLGEMPPRIGGVKVYTDNIRDQIMMDVEVFYAGDAHVKCKVKGIVCGVKDIQFIGDLRIILSPLINTIPLVGAVTYFLLRKPSIDFKLTDAGTLVDIPGLSDIMLAVINDIVASMMVLPNRQVFPLVTDLQLGYLRWSNPEGVVRIIILRARDLIKSDVTLVGKGKSDPFVKIKAQGNLQFKTKTIKNTTQPQWNEVFEFAVEQAETDVIEFEVYDEDPGKDDFIGRAQYPINTLLDKEAVETWLTLSDVKTGSLNVYLQYFTLTTDKSALPIIEQVNNPMIKSETLSKALLVVFIDRCINLPRSKRTQREPNPFCRIKVDKSENKTQTFEGQTSPSFEHISHILCSNPLQQNLTIEICDARSNNEIIAFFELPIKYIYDTDSMMIDTQTFPLKNSYGPLDNVSIVLRLCLSILSPKYAVSSPTSSIRSFDNSIKQELGVQKSLEVDSVIKSVPYRAILSAPEDISPSDSNIVLVADDPDLVLAPYGQIKLGIGYLIHRKVLQVTIYSCKNLINVHDRHLPDPYIRAYLVPEFKKDKKKTKFIHDALDPVYNDLFEWSASLAEIHKQNLYISIKNNSPLFTHEQRYMGEIQVDLSNLDPEKPSLAWYALQEPNTSAGGLIKIKYEPHEYTTQF